MLGASTTLVTPLGGETGDVFGHLISDHGVDVRIVQVAEPSGAYVHDRRERRARGVVAGDAQPARPPRGRRPLHGDARRGARGRRLRHHRHAPPGRRAARRAPSPGWRPTCARTASTVLVDLQGDVPARGARGRRRTPSRSARTSSSRTAGPRATDDDAVIAGIERLVEEGAERRRRLARRGRRHRPARRPARCAASGPEMTAIDPAGAGDSMTAALAFGRASGLPPRRGAEAGGRRRRDERDPARPRVRATPRRSSNWPPTSRSRRSERSVDEDPADERRRHRVAGHPRPRDRAARARARGRRRRAARRHERRGRRDRADPRRPAHRDAARRRSPARRTSPRTRSSDRPAWR